jgi:hypothetical protein
MSDLNPHTPADPGRSAGASAPGVSRRRLVRAGLSAAPVMAALKSNTVLAGDHSCIKPSTFSSLRAAQMQVSARRELKTDYECQSHGYWKNRDTGLPSGYKTSTLFISVDTGFTANPSNLYTGKTLQQVLEMGGNQGNAALARHVVAAFLTAQAYKDDPTRVMLTTSQCRTIWNSGGQWSPFAGASWTLNDTMGYFETVYGRAFL